MRHSFLCAAVAAFSILCVSCIKDGNKQAMFHFTSDQYYVVVGHAIQLEIEPSAPLSSFEWSTSEPGIATVESGFVTGVSAGLAVITATKDGFSADVIVSVSDVNVTSFKLSTPSKMKPGETVDISVTDIEPDYATAKDINWSIVDNNQGEYFSIVGVETDKVTVKCRDGAKDGYKGEVYGCNKDNSCRRSVIVTVEYRPVESLSLPSTLSVSKTETANLKCSVSPSNTTEATNFVWSSSDTSIATVTGNGLNATVTGVKEGSAKITVKDSKSGKSATCQVTVTFKRVISPDAKVGFYKNKEVVVDGKLYKVSSNISGSTFTILPHTASESCYVGLDDGYGLCGNELEVTVTISGGLYSECKMLFGSPLSTYGVLDNNQTGTVTVRIPNGNTASVNFRAQVATIAMEKTTTGNFTCFGSNVSYISPGGTFTITRPTGNTSYRCQFCVNCGNTVNNLYNQGPSQGLPNDYISNPYSKQIMFWDFKSPTLPSSMIDSYCRVTVTKNSEPGTYVFRSNSSYGYPDISFNFVVK